MEGKEGDLIIVAETRHFVRSFKKLSAYTRQQALIKIDLFKKFPTHAGLRIHKLNGRMRGWNAFWVTYDCRIIFHRTDRAVVFLDIGRHDIYD